MKKLFSLLLIVTLLLTCCSGALATSATFANTKVFLDMLDEKGISYTMVGIDPDGDEKVEIDNTSEFFSYTLKFFFTPDNETINIRVWDVIHFDEEDLTKVIRDVNSLNAGYKWIKFYVDETDNTVTASMDLIVRENGRVDEVAWEGTLSMVDLLDIGYELLSVYNK